MGAVRNPVSQSSLADHSTMQQNTASHTTQTPHHRVGVFLDVQNIYHSAKNLYRARVNFKELLKTVVGERALVRAFAYVVQSDAVLAHDAELRGIPVPAEPTGEESFFDALRKTGFELQIKDLQVYAGGSKKADWDVGLAIDAIRNAPALDTVILITGDGDFVPLVEYLQVGLGKRVEVAAFGRTSSGKLKEAANHFIEIDSIPRILLKIRNGGRKEQKTTTRERYQKQTYKHKKI